MFPQQLSEVECNSYFTDRDLKDQSVQLEKQLVHSNDTNFDESGSVN